MTGTYDPQLDMVYWPAGNPGPDFNGDDREGDNLYTDCILALEAKTGKLKWYYQFTPHDIHDWDAEEPPVLVDTNWQGQPRKLLIQANRNGFFYVFDRTTGKLLLAKPFLKKLNWAEGNRQGRPAGFERSQGAAERREPTSARAFQGGTNWYSTSFNPGTGLYYFQALERCNLYSKRELEWQAGKGYMGGRGASGSRRDVRKVAARDQYSDRRDRLGSAAGRRAVPRLRGRAVDRVRPGVLRRKQRLVHGGRRGERQSAVGVPGESRVARFAHDLHVRQQAVRRDRVGLEHHRVRAAGVALFPGGHGFALRGSGPELE